MASESNGRLVIRGGTLVDGTGTKPIQEPVIVVENGKIKSVDERSQVSESIADGAEVIDASGKTILPGLWDSHSHLLDWMGEL